MELPPVSVFTTELPLRKAGLPATQSTDTLQDGVAWHPRAGVTVTCFTDSYVIGYTEKVTLRFTYKETPGTALRASENSGSRVRRD